MDLHRADDPEPMVRGLVVQPPGATLEKTGHEGSCENNRDGLIRGWVWRRDRPGVPVAVALYLDGELWRVETANLFRQDLAVARKGTGAYGFAVPVPIARSAAPSRVEVRLAGTGLPLRRSPLRVEGRIVTTLG